MTAIPCMTGLTRPERLCDETRQFALDSMKGKYGDEARAVPAVSLDGIEGFDDLSPDEKYAAAVETIARDCPLRFISGERIVGSATLGAAIDHVVPAFRNGSAVFPSVSHVTLGFRRILELGLDGIEAELDRYADKPYTVWLKRAAEAFRLWHGRILRGSEAENPACHTLLKKVPMGPASTFREAVQSLWLTFAFTRLTGNWSGIGRIDEMLGPYLKRDLAEGRLTLDEAREILAHFFIKGCEWIVSDTPVGSGDAQHYQNIVLSGVNENGKDVTNEVTFLVLDVIEELGISDYPVTVRLNRNTDPGLLRRIAEVVRYGGGIVAVYNEDLILSSLTASGYPLEEARRFANDGCWEVQIPGNTYFIYGPFDGYSLLMKDVLGLPDAPRHFDSLDELWNAYADRLRSYADEVFRIVADSRGYYTEDGEWVWRNSGPPCAVISLFTEDCAKNGRSYYEGGPRYTVFSPHIGGAPDAGNSLHAIDRLVFRDKLVSFDELTELLRNDWEGAEPLRRYARERIPYYGNDDDEADSYVTRILDTFADAVLAHSRETPVLFIPGVSTFGRQIEWSSSRAPSPMGTKKCAILSGNASPTPGTDTEGATAVVKSYCKADLKKQVSGAALDIRLHPSAVSGGNGLAALVGLYRTFAALGGFFMQTDVIDSSVLEAAREHPEEYKTLSVRVSGWNARFVTLNREWQDMIIERTSGGTV
ncbi:MAG: hypothetical protein E7576_06070 [Ruminococcaceae bacterium]|nr:hypothetical protein [Oscillospiraceae bacterium]